ncbi:MAG: tRNA (adenosine(37)-N6)-threonylcarbamoyltransferase complex dimerization subunit type 1 TsaB [Pseudomonadota bacterium]
MILAIDASENSCSVAIGSDDWCDQRISLESKGQARVLLPMLQELLDAHNYSLNDIEVIAVAAGPGAFTGIRIACAFAQGLSFSLNRPMIAISSLKALAHKAHRLTGCHAVYVAMDARMNEIYYAGYRFDKNRVEILQIEQALPLSEWKIESILLENESSIIFGSGAALLSPAILLEKKSVIYSINSENHSFETLNHEEISSTIESEDVLILARTEWQNKNIITANNFEPIWLRPDTVQIR